MINRLLESMSVAAVARCVMVALLFSYPVVALFEARVPTAPVVAAAALGVFGLVALLRMPRRETVAIILASAGLLLWFLGAVLIAQEGSDPEKIRQFGLTLLLFGLVTAIAIVDNAVIDRLPAGLMLLGGFALSLLVIAPGTYQEGRVSFDENNPIWMARTIGMLGIGALAIYMRTRRDFVVYIAIFMVSAAGVVMTGSRGPLTGMVMCAGLMVVMSRGATRTNLIFLGGFALLVLGVTLYGFAPLDEVRGLTFSSDDASSAIRLAMYDYTLRTIGENSSGIGVGWFTFEGLKWPHNIYLEIFVEWGWITGSAFLLFTLVGVIGVFSLGPRFDIVKLLLVYDLINSCLSGDISSPRYLYALLLVGAAAMLYKLIWPRPLATLNDANGPVAVSEAVRT